MRRFLRALAGIWLACQLVAAASPLTLVSDAFGIDQASCCPGVAPGQMCPMHHHGAADKKTCKMESACAHHDAALLTILAVGVVQAAIHPVAPVSHSPARFVSATATVARAVIPDVPPPQYLA
jgi:hypothetical protein